MNPLWYAKTIEMITWSMPSELCIDCVRQCITSVPNLLSDIRRAHVENVCLICVEHIRGAHGESPAWHAWIKWGISCLKYVKHLGNLLSDIREAHGESPAWYTRSTWGIFCLLCVDHMWNLLSDMREAPIENPHRELCGVHGCMQEYKPAEP